MKKIKMFLLAGSLFALAACSTDRGGATDEYSTGTGADTYNPAPAASPTFRPGMNPEDPRDAQFPQHSDPNQPPPASR